MSISFIQTFLIEVIFDVFEECQNAIITTVILNGQRVLGKYSAGNFDTNLVFKRLFILCNFK